MARYVYVVPKKHKKSKSKKKSYKKKKHPSRAQLAARRAFVQRFAKKARGYY
jgi:hypothetical protein